MPTCVILYMAFSEWAYSYLFSYQHVYKIYGNKHAMIAFITVANILWFITFLFWFLLLIRKPGHILVKVPPYSLSRFVYNGSKLNFEHKNETFSSLSMLDTQEDGGMIQPPPMFDCDRNGLPSWCSECCSLKLLRSHHSSVTNQCIPWFDHFCTFVGSTIGKQNYGYFIIYVMSIELLMIFTWITVVVYSGIKHSMHSALIVFVIITGALSISVAQLEINLISDLFYGETTIERLDRLSWKRSLKKGDKNNENFYDYSSYVNVQHPHEPNLRLIVPLTINDKPYDNGVFKNIRMWFYNINQLKTPIDVSNFQYDMYGDKFKRDIQKRIEENNYRIFGYESSIEPVSI